MGAMAIIFVVDMFISCICIWLAGHFSFVKLKFPTAVGIVAIVSLVSLLPHVGWILGLIIFVTLLVKAADCTPVDAVWVVIFTKLFSILALVALRYFDVYEKLVGIDIPFFS